MKRLILALAFLMPVAANAALMYTYDQHHLDNTTHTSSDWDESPYLGHIAVGDNEFEFAFDNPLYYKWELNIDMDNSHYEKPFYLIGMLNGFFGFVMRIDHAFSGKRTAVGSLDLGTLENFIYDEPNPWSGLAYAEQLNDGFSFGLAAFTDDWRYDFEQDGAITLAFLDGNKFTLADEPYFFVPEPATAALFGLGLAFAGFRRSKK
ncbi:PEP-CTERM sorting domain-containing protein [Alteromonas pelagimontana]|uniref:PEP-CTERM sorting domain-containing protein n=1 Tax=Alteromonas pelagimontana TaxID=1858656 RepID=A0A6M4M8V5_9ALTE|nr:PEP-CTERM sorting domain-containing protein [Alteromonas pelagimontana]QJR79593.1 PEP-CTERM sorting domain-containing protein [Alteromonas pelagimontana]